MVVFYTNPFLLRNIHILLYTQFSYNVGTCCASVLAFWTEHKSLESGQSKEPKSSTQFCHYFQNFMYRVTYLTLSLFQEVAYTGEYTLEAFSEFLEEQRKKKAEPGEEVGIWPRPDLLCEPGRFPAGETSLSWLQPSHPPGPVLGWFWPILTSSWLLPSPQQLSPVAQPGRHSTHPLTSLFLSHKASSPGAGAIPESHTSPGSLHKGACTLAAVQQHLLTVSAGKIKASAECQS